MEKAKLVLITAFNRTRSGETKAAFPPHELRSEQQARHLAVDLAIRYWGVLAWTLTLDPRSHRYGDPVELVRYGVVPDMLLPDVGSS